MAAVTGEMFHEHGGRSYRLHLTMRGIGRLQAMHGNDLGGLMTGESGKIPRFDIFADAISLALEAGEHMSKEDAYDLSEAMLVEDMGLVARLFKAALPSAMTAAGGKDKAGGKGKASKV